VRFMMIKLTYMWFHKQRHYKQTGIHIAHKDQIIVLLSPRQQQPIVYDVHNHMTFCPRHDVRAYDVRVMNILETLHTRTAFEEMEIE
jgi:hypothetical protein